MRTDNGNHYHQAFDKAFINIFMYLQVTTITLTHYKYRFKDEHLPILFRCMSAYHTIVLFNYSKIYSYDHK